jgi:hypothetical protein
MKNFIILFWTLSLTGCLVRHKAEGDVNGKTENKVTAEIVFRVDLDVCQDLPLEEKLFCIQAITESISDIVDIAKVLACPTDSAPEIDCQVLSDLLQKTENEVALLNQ